MTNPTAKSRCFHLTPDRFVIGLLVVECLLWLSERFRWFGFNAHKGWTVLIAAAMVGATILLMLVWFTASLIFRWRFQFSIRSLLVLTVAIALPCSWLAVEMKQAQKQRDAVEKIRNLGEYVHYDWQLVPGAQPPEPAWLRKLLGEDFFARCVDAYILSDAGLENLDGLPEVKNVEIFRLAISDAELKHVAGLVHVLRLRIFGTEVTDVSLERLEQSKALPQLETLDLFGTEVTDAGLGHLSHLARLRKLEIFNTRVTDAGLEKLRILPRLQSLTLGGDLLTALGVKHLKALSGLQELRVYNIADDNLRCLGDLSQLKRLIFVGHDTTDKGLKQFQETLPECKITFDESTLRRF